MICDYVDEYTSTMLWSFETNKDHGDRRRHIADSSHYAPNKNTHNYGRIFCNMLGIGDGTCFEWWVTMQVLRISSKIFIFFESARFC